MKKHLLFLFISIVSTWSIGQSGSLDTTFNPGDLGFRIGDGPNSSVYTTSIQTDGKIIIGGNFTSYNSRNSRYLTRLNNDGTIDSTFNIGTGANNNIRTINLQTDGKIIIGGNFTTFNGTAINRIVRLNSDGTLDASFNPGTGSNGLIITSSLQPDGKIIIGGHFTTYNGTARNYIARLNSDGTLDASFNPGTSVNSVVSTLALQPDGKILIGGNFSSFNGTTINCLVRLNSTGTFDATFNLGTALNGSVETISIQPDSKIIIGGAFTTFNGTSRNNIARLSSIGALDLTFNPGTGANATIRSSIIQPDGKIIIGGDFTTFNGSAINHINRLSSTGTSDATFVIGNGANETIRSFSLQADGKIIMGGDFTAYKGLAGTYISRIDSIATMDLTFNPGNGVNGTVYSTIIQPDGKILIGGDFSGYNGRARGNVARINIDGTTDLTFNSINPADGRVYSMALQSNGRIMIGGAFTTSNGFSRNGIARITTNGFYDASFNPGTGPSGMVYAIAIQTDGKIIIGGAFTTFNGTNTNRIVRLNSNGSIDASFNPGTGANGDIRSITLQPDGKIIIGGAFTNFNGSTERYLTRLNTDGTIDPLYYQGPTTVYTTTLQPDGKIIIGGANFILRLNIDGSSDNTFNSGIIPNGIVYTTALQADGKIVIGGAFTVQRNHITRLNSNGSLDNLFNTGTGTSGIVYSTTIQSDEKVIIGGDFISYNSIGRNRIARLNVCINPSRTDSIISCGPYTWIDGNTYSNNNNSATFTIQNPAGCDSIISLNLTVNPIPIAPTGSTSQTFCVAGTTISSLSASGLTGSTIQWYTTANGGIPLASSTTLVNGTTYFASQTLNNCESTLRLAVTVSIILIPMPTGSATQTFCTGATVASLVANGTTIKWYTSASGGTPLTASSTLINGTTYYASQTASGCESTSRLPVTVNITNSPAPSGSTTQIQCTGATVANLVANGTNIQWYSTISSTTPLATSTVLVNGTTYYATQTVSGCQSTSRLAVTISIINPSAPSGSTNQTFCYGATIADLIATGSNIQWYPVAVGGTPAATSALLISGNTYFATQTVSGCESTNRLAVTVSVAISPVPTPAGSTSQTFCNSATVSNLAATGTSIQWYSTANGGTALSSSTQLVNGTTYYAAQTVSGCQSTTRLAVTVSINVPAAPGGFSSQSFCNGATIANLIANGSNIQWYSTASGGTALSASALLTNGATYYATQTVSGCTSSSRLAVTVSISSSIAYSEICLVSVDNNDGKNIVIWEKATNQRIEYYKIYKQNTINSQYDSIAYVPIDSFSVFKDFNSNPSQQSDSYKISAVDSCGIEGPVLTAHTTIHLTANQGVNNNVNLLWNAYTGFSYPNFEIYRSNNGALYTLIGTVANSSFSYTDVTPPAGTNYYYVSVTKPVPCNPAKAAPVLKSNSNILDALGNQVISSSEPLNLSNNFKIYPNPVKDILTLEVDPSYLELNYRIVDVLGREVLNGTINEQINQINLQDLVPGIYILFGEKESIKYKIVKE